MNITIQISDNDYKSLIDSNKRLSGSIALVNPSEGNFHAYKMYEPHKGAKYIRLPHGRACITEKSVSLRLCVSRSETDISPTDAIYDETWKARQFFDKQLQD